MTAAKKGPERQKKPRLSRVVMILLAAVLILPFLFLIEPSDWQRVIAAPHSNRMLFIGLMAVLPIFGVTIIIFLVFIGIKFGTLAGILISGLLMLFNMLVAYLISHSFLRPRIDSFIGEHHWSQPKMPAGKKELYAFLFIAIPGLPYAVKNYLLALSGLPFLHYLAICWTVQLLMGIPFIVLGEAAKLRHGGALSIAIAMLISGFLVVSWLRREFSALPPKE